MIKVILLDFDGVIVESVNIKTEAFGELFQQYKNLVDKIVQYHLQNNAISRFIKFKHIYENILGKEYNEKIGKELGKKFSKIVFQKVVECPSVVGAEEFLKTFSKIYPIYLISATPQRELKGIVAKRNIKNYFKKVFGSPPGNKVEHIIKALGNEKANPKEAISIGDMIEDYRVAQKTGVQFVGRKSIEDFGEIDAPIFPDMKGVKKWIEDKIKKENI